MRALCLFWLACVVVVVSPRLEGQEADSEKMRVYVDRVSGSYELADLGKIGTTLILREIGQSDHFQLVESLRLKELLKQQELQQSTVRDEEVVRAAQLSGAQWVVFPELLLAGDVYSFSIRIVEIESGKIPALAQEVFSDRTEILPRIKSATRDMLREFAAREGLSPSVAESAPVENQTAEGTQQEEAQQEALKESLRQKARGENTTKQEGESEPSAGAESNGNGKSAGVTTNVWHFTFNLGVGLWFEQDRALLLTAGARTGPTIQLGGNGFLAPFLRYRLSYDLLEHSYDGVSYSGYYGDDEIESTYYNRSLMHHASVGLAMGGADPNAAITHALFLGAGVDWLSIWYEEELLPFFSTYLGYDLSGKAVGASIELGLSSRDEMNFLWLNLAVNFGWPPLPRRSDFKST